MRKLGPIPSNLLVSGALLGASLLLGACQAKEAAPPAAAPVTLTHATISNEVAGTCVVAAVNAKTRVVTLRRGDGELVEVKCGEEVKNFAHIAAGDTLRVQFTETLEAKLLTAGESAQPAAGVAATTSAEPGATPAGAAVVAISAIVKVESVDLAHDIVVFSLASGELTARRLATPEGKEFAKGLKVGDAVQLDYAQVLAVALEKV